MNSRSSSVGKGYENEFSEFLIKRIGNAGGSLQLQHITGHLSQVRSEVRNAIGSSGSDLLQFLKRHDNLFNIEENVVSLVKFPPSNNSGYDSDTSSAKSYSNLPSIIKNGRGVVVKVFPNFGFIKSKEPIKTEIYFASFCFGNKNIDLTSFLNVGSIVFFNAQRKPVTEEKNNCKYRAVKVWREGNTDENNVIIQKSRKTRETGLYDPLYLESEGVIQKIFPNLGFISVNGDDSNTVFFHKNRVVNYDNIVDLTKVFTRGDSVEFTAHRSSKPDAKARWEATKVWKVSGKIKENTSLSNEPVPKLTKAHEMMKNQCGKIYLRSHGAVIKFGKNELADGDSALYYICGTQVTDLGWEFTEGDDICFDAVKIKSVPGWKAVLVWSGEKPNIVLPVNLGDYSEFTEDDDDDDGEVDSSVYASKSSLCISESSNLSFKSEKLSSRTKDRMKQKAQALSDSLSDKGAENASKTLLKNSKTSSRESLNSLPYSDEYCFSNRKLRSTNKKLSKTNSSSSRNSLCSLTASEQHNLKSSEKMVNLSSHKSVNQLNKIDSNWNHNPNHDDEAYESMETPKNFKSGILLKYDREIGHFTDDEVENSSEYASADEEEESIKIKEIVDKNAEMETDKTLSQNKNLECAAVIKRYHDVEGEVCKVFPRYAEVKSRISPENILFSLNDFYSKGRPGDELEDDLKSLLKLGEIIKFNCFIIIDNSGQSWQKVTLAWKGCKPRCSEEMSPEDFIKQNNLSVTVKNEMPDKVIQKKFLTSFVDKTPDNSIDNLSKTESCSEDESLTLRPKFQAHSKIDLPDDSESLSDTIYRILNRDVLPKDSTVDIKSVSEEIISILQNHTNKTSVLMGNISSEERYMAESLENDCLKCKQRSSDLSNSYEKTNTSTQTIVTGEIISQNILPDC